MEEPKITTVTSTGVEGTTGTSGVIVNKETTVPPNNDNLPKTQEEMNLIVQKRLARAKEEFEKRPDVVAAIEAKKKLDELIKGGMSEPEKIAASLKETQDKLTMIEAENLQLKTMQLRQEALIKANLPVSFADRMHGITGEEITADILSLKELLKSISSGQEVHTGGAGNPAQQAGSVTLEQQLAEAQKTNNFVRIIAIKNKIAERDKPK
jgi:hypothetical protein